MDTFVNFDQRSEADIFKERHAARTRAMAAKRKREREQARAKEQAELSWKAAMKAIAEDAYDLVTVDMRGDTLRGITLSKLHDDRYLYKKELATVVIDMASRSIQESAFLAEIVGSCRIVSLLNGRGIRQRYVFLRYGVPSREKLKEVTNRVDCWEYVFKY